MSEPEVVSQRTEGFAGLKPWITWLEADSFVAQGFIPAEASCRTARLSLQEAERYKLTNRIRRGMFSVHFFEAYNPKPDTCSWDIFRLHHGADF